MASEINAEITNDDINRPMEKRAAWEKPTLVAIETSETESKTAFALESESGDTAAFGS